ncbi:kinetochore-associated Ndc80 complex subunit nuf2 [Allomyces arbusculus]|nr:kinetochore-associated Ndc80 complex subunit nuf2 [Allomyces arbusculus]
MNRRSPVIPILRGAELNNALRDLGLGHLSEDALLRGTNTLLPALQQFVEILRGVAYQDLEEAGHKIMETVTRHPDLYPDLRVQVTVVKHIRHILRDMGFPDFSLRDVQRPTPDRLRKVFSYLIAFKRQGDKWMLRHQEHQARLDKIELRRLEVFDEHDQLTAQKQQRIEKDRRDKEEAKAVGKRNIELDREAAAAGRAYEAKVKAIKQAEEDAEAIKDEIATRTTELQSLEAEARQLEKWVIDDPKAWHASIDTLKKSKQELVNAITRHHEGVNTCQAMLREIKAAMPDVGDFTRKLIEVQDLRKDLGQVRRDVMEKKNTLTSIELKANDMETKVNNEDRKVTEMTALIAEQRRQLAKELDVRKAECEEALKALDLARNQQMIVDDAAAEEARNIEQVKAATQAMRDKYLAECAVIEAKYEVLAQTVVKYVDAMEAQMGQSVMFSADEDEDGDEGNAMEM